MEYRLQAGDDNDATFRLEAVLQTSKHSILC